MVTVVTKLVHYLHLRYGPGAGRAGQGHTGEPAPPGWRAGPGVFLARTGARGLRKRSEREKCRRRELGLRQKRRWCGQGCPRLALGQTQKAFGQEKPLPAPSPASLLPLSSGCLFSSMMLLLLNQSVMVLVAIYPSDNNKKKINHLN